MQLPNNKIYLQRRQQLVSLIKEKYGSTDGVIILAAGFEGVLHRFRQESSFYYFTGLNEPALILCLHLDGRQELYVPNFGKERHKWVKVIADADSDPKKFALTSIKHLSVEPMRGYSYPEFFVADGYTQLINDLKNYLAKNYNIFGILDQACLQQYHLQNSLFAATESSLSAMCNVSDVVYHMRRFKDKHEQELMRKAIDITMQAQHVAAGAIKPGVGECQVQAVIEKVFRQQQSSHNSFPTIVAAGANSTVLHYVENNCTIEDGDLVVVDIGAEYGHYAADLTRTYPASGSFTARQKEVYQLVLDAQTYAFEHAKPGMFLRNPGAKEQSLHWLVTEFFKRHGYAQYFPHGIGHFQGLDVHDVGDYTKPLEPGDIFTIEPGLYIPSEKIGVRIEDNFVMTAAGAQCLSSQLVSKVDDVCNLLTHNS